MTNGGTTPDNLNKQFDFDEVARLPEVADAAVVNYYFPSGTTPSGRAISPGDFAPLASLDGKFGTTINQARVLRGRNAITENEITVTPLVAQRLHVGVGDTLQLYLGGTEALTGPPAGARPSAFLIVGVVAMQAGFPPLTGGLPPPVLLAPTYAASHPDAAHVLMVRLHHGSSDVAAFTRELGRLAPGQQIVTANGTEFGSINRSLSLQANALRIVGLLVGIVLLLVLGQVFVVLGFAESTDNETFRVLGVTRRQLRSLDLQRSLLLAGVATVVAIVTAVALSPLTPVGVARDAEPHAGIAVNLAYLALGALVVFGIVAGLSVLGSVLAARRRARASVPGRESRVGHALASAGASTAATAGVRMALEPGRGRSVVPVRATIVSATLAVALIVGVLGFSASLAKLFDNPRLYGWNWDIQIGDAFAPALDDQAARVSANPAAEAVAVGTAARVDMRGKQVDLLAIESRKGTITPIMVAGHVAQTPDEIVLGARTLRDLGLAIGDPIDVELGGTSARYGIVGEAVFADFAGAARLGEGAATTLAGIRRLQPDVASDLVLVRVTRDAAGSALVDDLKRQVALDVYVPAKPADLAELDRIGGLPSVLAALLGAIAIATLAYALVSSVRQRRRDIAILKVLGFGRGQVSASVAWQSSVIAAIAIVIGIPVGVVGSRWAWRLFAHELGVPPRPATSALVASRRSAGDHRAREPHRALAGAARRPHRPRRGTARRVTPGQGYGWMCSRS